MLKPSNIYRALVLGDALKGIGNPEVWKPDPIFLLDLGPVEEENETTTREKPVERVAWCFQSSQEAVPLHIVWSPIPPNQKKKKLPAKSIIKHF